MGKEKRSSGNEQRTAGDFTLCFSLGVEVGRDTSQPPEGGDITERLPEYVKVQNKIRCHFLVFFFFA